MSLMMSPNHPSPPNPPITITGNESNLAEGQSNKSAATHLGLPEGTVKNYVSTILDKLHAENRTHATTIARKQGLIK